MEGTLEQLNADSLWRIGVIFIWWVGDIAASTMIAN